jgi:hypothetical protein
MKFLFKTRDSTTTVIIHRLNIPIKLKALSYKELMIITLNLIYKNINISDFGAELIISSTINFKWDDKKLLENYNINDARKIVSMVLLAGEMSLLANKILELTLRNMFSFANWRGMNGCNMRRMQ